MEAVKLGQKIRYFRQQRGITQMQLAERIGVSYQQVQKYEKDKSQITVDRLITIAEVLETSPASLLSEKAAPRLSEKPARYASAAKGSGEEGRLLQLFVRIRSRNVKRRLLRLLESIVEDQSRR